MSGFARKLQRTQLKKAYGNDVFKKARLAAEQEKKHKEVKKDEPNQTK